MNNLRVPENLRVMYSKCIRTLTSQCSQSPTKVCILRCLVTQKSRTIRDFLPRRGNTTGSVPKLGYTTGFLPKRGYSTDPPGHKPPPPQTHLPKFSQRKQIPRTQPSKPNTTILTGSYVLLLIPVTAFALGTWQIYRRGWKLNLIDELENRTTRQPVPLPPDLSEIEKLEYIPLIIRGTFDHNREFLLGPRTNVIEAVAVNFELAQDRIGYNVITPFKLADRDETILVNRGWVHRKLRDPTMRKVGQIEGEVQLTGCLRTTEQHRWGKAAIADNNTFMFRDIDKMAHYAGTSPTFFECDIMSSVDGGPLGGQTRTTLRNEHGSYILTWYCLAFISFFLWYYRFARPPLPDSVRLFNHYKDIR